MPPSVQINGAIFVLTPMVAVTSLISDEVAETLARKVNVQKRDPEGSSRRQQRRDERKLFFSLLEAEKVRKLKKEEKRERVANDSS